MGLDIAGNTIVKSGTGVALNSLVFNSAGQGSANSAPGYCGWKQGAPDTYYSAPAGWEITGFLWRGTGMHPSNGGFTCPVAGYYVMGYNCIHRGGTGIPSSGVVTSGYACFSKNGVQTYFIHWNQALYNIPGYTSWNSGGQSMLFNCAAGDTLIFAVNVAPAPANAVAVSNNYGKYPNYHGAVWCRLVG